MTKTLRVFGDSFSTPYFCVTPADSFWGLIGKHIEAKLIVNYSQTGMSFEQILHIICNETFNFQTDYFVIGVPPVARISTIQPGARHTYSIFDSTFKENKMNMDVISETNQHDFAEIFVESKMFIASHNQLWLETKTCDLIYLLYNYLKNQNAKFLILNLTIPFYYDPYWPVSKSIMQFLKTIPECILFDDTYFSTNKQSGIKPVDRDPNDLDCWFGHHGAEGNHNWFNKILKNKINGLKW